MKRSKPSNAFIPVSGVEDIVDNNDILVRAPGNDGLSVNTQGKEKYGSNNLPNVNFVGGRLESTVQSFMKNLIRMIKSIVNVRKRKNHGISIQRQ